MAVGGWTFNAAREIWWAKTGPNTWTEIKGTPGEPPPFSPQNFPEVPAWVRLCGHHGCVITGPHAHGEH